MIADANGDLFGTTEGGGVNDFGTVFEIPKTRAGYASTPTTLASFNGANGASLMGSLIADANGDLFGTTFTGGADSRFATGFGGNGDGTVFEIKKTPTGYASTPTTLVSFNSADGFSVVGSAPDNRRPERRLVWHNRWRRRLWRGHRIRGRQDCRCLREHAHQLGQFSGAPLSGAEGGL